MLTVLQQVLPRPWCLYYKGVWLRGGLKVKHSFFLFPLLRNSKNRDCVFVVDFVVSHTESFRTELLIFPACDITYTVHMEKEMATHSSTLAWRIAWREEPGRLQSMGSQRVGHDWATSLSLSYCSWGSQVKNTEVVCHCLLQWTKFCQNSPLWPSILDGPTLHGSLFHWVRQGCGPCDQLD